LPNQSGQLELARRLHDGLAQNLAALGYKLDEIIADPELSSAIRSDLRKIRIDLINVINDFRDEIYLLRTLDFKGLSAQLTTVFSSQSLAINLPHGEITREREDALSKAILEIARNSAAHSKCTSFAIDFESLSDRIVIKISDNGSGKVEPKSGSFGLNTICEEIQRAGGVFQQNSDASGNNYLIELKKL
jgi:signal transduction histidine kinase